MSYQCKHCQFHTAYRTSVEQHLRNAHGIAFYFERHYRKESTGENSTLVS